MKIFCLVLLVFLLCTLPAFSQAPTADGGQAEPSALPIGGFLIVSGQNKSGQNNPL